MPFVTTILLLILAFRPFTENMSDRINWNGIVPLHSSRQEVETKLGKPKGNCNCEYETSNEYVQVRYAESRCSNNGDLSGWDVASDTVLSYTVTPKKEEVKLIDILGKANLSLTVDDTFNKYYNDFETGVRYKVKLNSDLISEITYLPAKSDIQLRCNGFPTYDPARTTYQRYDIFKLGSWENIANTLDQMIINTSPEMKGYLIIYLKKGEKKKKGLDYLSKMQNYLKSRKTKPQTIFGGYRERSEVEVFLIPKEWEAPLPTPYFSDLTP